MRMSQIGAVFVAVFVLLPSVLLSAPQTDRLLSVLGGEALIDMMRREGVRYSAELADDMLPGGNSEGWQHVVARIYDSEKMTQSVRSGFARSLEGVDLAPMDAFFSTPLGLRVIRLELSTREAMMDKAIEEAATERGRAVRAEGDDIDDLVRRFIEAGDLLEANVEGALNSNVAFYRGLVDGGAFRMSEADILADVWAQETATRIETEDWLYGFLVMAYSPLERGDLERYTQFMQTDAGRTLSRAQFAAFDSMYRDISYALGLAAARIMKSEDI